MAFEEEKEWRVIKTYDIANKQNVSTSKAYARQDRVVPYYDVAFSDNYPLISEVILGPKNITPPNIIKAILKSYGFNDVSVKTSKAMYKDGNHLTFAALGFR